MKKIILLFISAILLVSILNYVSALANPATVYCEEMNNEFGGYDYQIKADENGNQYGVCIPSNGEEYEEWAFLRGQVGADDSYCAKKGYGIKTVSENGNEYAVCVVPKSETIESENESERLALSSEDAGEQEIPMEELMNLGEKVAARGSLKSRQDISSESEEGKRLMSSFQEQRNLASSTYNQTNYSYWDWRNPPSNTQYARSKYTYFDDNKGWMTSVKNQASCGSCWSFGIHGAVESRYELNLNNSRLNSDLSEQNSVMYDNSCLQGASWPNSDCDADYSNCSCNNGCNGGYLNLALEFLKLNGTVDENCSTYQGCKTWNYGTHTCDEEYPPTRCSDAVNRTWTIGGADYSGYYYDFSNGKLEQWIIDYGPVPISIYMVDNPDAAGFINCGAGGDSNHAVVLMGYNDTGNTATSYWILKNSWGENSWTSDGYFKIRYNDNCNVGDEVYYINTTNPPDFKPTITLNSPANDNQTSNTLISFNFSVSNRVYQNSTCDLIINNATQNTTSLAINGTSTILSYNLSDGQSNWSINCWENGLGIVNSSEIRTITTDTTAPTLIIHLPSANSYQNYDNILLSWTVNDTSYNYTLIEIFNSTNDNVTSGIAPYTYGPYTYPDYLLNYTDMPDDVYKVVLTAFDESLNNVSTIIYNVTVDTIFPSINFTSPTETSGTTNTTRSYILVNITANDTNLKNITLRLYNSTSLMNSTNATTSPLYSNFSSLADGIYYFNATACDNAGNCNNTTETRNVTIDANPPIITINSPANGSYYSSVIFNASLNKNGTCLYSIDGGTNKSMGSTDNRNFNATNSSMSQVAHNFTFSCNDSYNNWNFTSRMFYFDTTSPVVTLISPANESEDYEEDESIPFKYNVTDNFGIANCSLLIDTVIHLTNTSITNNTIETISHSIALSEIYDWTIICYDRAGNHHDPSSWEIDIQAAADDDDDDDSSSSGSSGSDDPVTYQVSDTKLSQGYTKQLTTGDKLNFSIDSVHHILTLKSIKGKNATITIASTIQTVIMTEGDEEKFDLTPDNYYDLSVTLVSISGSTAKLTLKDIYEIKPVTLGSSDNSSLNLTTNSSSNSTENNDGWANDAQLKNIKKFFSSIFSNKYVLIGIGVLIVGGIVSLVWYARIKIRQKKGWDK